MAKFRSWNEKLGKFCYFENGYYWYEQDYAFRTSILITEHFNWQNAELVDCKEKELLYHQLRLKRHLVIGIDSKLQDLDKQGTECGSMKRHLLNGKETKLCEIYTIECVLLDVFHMTEKELKEI